MPVPFIPILDHILHTWKGKCNFNGLYLKASSIIRNNTFVNGLQYL